MGYGKSVGRIIPYRMGFFAQLTQTNVITRQRAETTRASDDGRHCCIFADSCLRQDVK